eukprot:TRINITY_DN82562_c0_g1_i1.p1 TRINITY_DN82562_c0_g1~~TRINITY_DN82562_c0_g1_i1.p1  ORF type:complete len:551 (+),score=94.18 TRINITY_DN82562_c0_g1_i1:29-1681(+)
MPSRPPLSASDDASSAEDRRLAGAAMLGTGPDPKWIDKFMTCILSKEYEPAREVLRGAIARGVNSSIAEQYAGVLEDFLQKRDEMENPVILGRYDQCIVRKSTEGQGNGLFVPGYQTWGAQLWKERPLACIQSPCSRKCVQVCRACLLPVGSLASQLRYLGLEVPKGAEEVLISNGECCSQEYDEEEGSNDWVPGQVIPCSEPGCSEVFCSIACRDWALKESSHAVLCAGRMRSECLTALRGLEQLADETDTEHLLLLAHVVAQMVLQRRAGTSLDEVKRRFAEQFASSPWDKLAEGNGCSKGDDTPEVRRTNFAKASLLIEKIFQGEVHAEALLEPSLLSGLLGTFELVNMCISIPHPLNSEGQRVQELLSGRVAAQLDELQKPLEDSDSDEDGEVQAGEIAASSEGNESDREAKALAAAAKGDLFENVIGTALCEALAFTNHSCLPNCRIDFACASHGEAKGPGLWVYSVTRRPLVPGDEVLMSYVPSVVGKPLEVRQRKMQKFGFPCSCRSCETDKALAADDDVTRLLMNGGLRGYMHGGIHNIEAS